MAKSELLPMTQKPLLHVDATPDDRYPIRILEAYLHDAQCNWDVSGLDEAATSVWAMMNEHNLQREVILRKAIAAVMRSLVGCHEVDDLYEDDAR